MWRDVEFNEFGGVDDQRGAEADAHPPLETTTFEIGAGMDVEAIPDTVLLFARIAMKMLDTNLIEWDWEATAAALDAEIRRRGLYIE